MRPDSIDLFKEFGTALKIKVVSRTFKFKQPAGTSRGVYLLRKVWYIVLTSSDRNLPLLGLGECAPLHDLSCDALPDYEERLKAICRDIGKSGRMNYKSLLRYPSMLFGLESAVLSARASLAKHDYRQLFDTPFTRGEAGIPINGLVWMGSYEEMCRRMEEKLEAGFRCIKIKIGAIDFESEINLLRKLRNRFGKTDVELRVDANGAFPVQEALHKLEVLAQFDIHSIEQPIRAGQWNEMAGLCRMSPLPIALDEELIGINDPDEKQRLLDTIRPQFIILKPTLHGGMAGAEEWMEEARQRGIGYWITSALETNVGLNAIAQWASSKINDLHTTMPQGLGTGQLFTDNFKDTDLQIEGDCLWAAHTRERKFKSQLHTFLTAWNSREEKIEVQTSGSTGTPKKLTVKKSSMKTSAEMTCDFLHLKEGDTALLCMPLDFIAGKMMVVRSLVRKLKLQAIAPSSHPFKKLHYAPDFVAMTPMQVYETLKVPRERFLLKKVRHLIIGGGAVNKDLELLLQDFPNEVWSTYGMTETLSHIALRRLNGKDRSEAYAPFKGIAVSLSHEGCLVINAPMLCPHPLTTNDIAEIRPDGSFRILGRKDNIICSGGIKIQTEEVERKLETLPCPYMITAVPDPKFGEAVTLLYKATPDVNQSEIEKLCVCLLSKYERPRHYIKTAGLPVTETGKPARMEARELAIGLLKEQALSCLCEDEPYC